MSQAKKTVMISGTARDLLQHRKDKHEPMPEVEIDPEDEFHNSAQT
jgi:hypothetical protein